MRLRLTKYYLDVTTDQGDTVIAYWGQLQWRRLRLHFSAVQVSRAGAALAPWRVSALDAAPPEVNAEGVRWSAPHLDLHMEGCALSPPVERRLFEGPDGSVNWVALLPRAEMCIQVGSERFRGLGYVERLDMSLPPWRLPAREVRWGRLLTANHALAWIEWRGELPLRFAILDGAVAELRDLSDQAVHGERGWVARLDDPQVIGDDAVGGLLAPFSHLRRLMAPITHWQQLRWRSRATLSVDGQPPEVGWAIHERVTR
jgi:hypothetical protein